MGFVNYLLVGRNKVVLWHHMHVEYLAYPFGMIYDVGYLAPAVICFLAKVVDIVRQTVDAHDFDPILFKYPISQRLFLFAQCVKPFDASCASREPEVKQYPAVLFRYIGGVVGE